MEHSHEKTIKVVKTMSEMIFLVEFDKLPVVGGTCLKLNMAINPFLKVTACTGFYSHL